MKAKTSTAKATHVGKRPYLTPTQCKISFIHNTPYELSPAPMGVRPPSFPLKMSSSSYDPLEAEDAPVGREH